MKILQEGLSVIVPVYNARATIKECIGSISNQTYKNLEIICVNDGSKDNSLELLNELAKEDSRVKVINQENSGVSVARNVGIESASFNYLTFVDSDDTIEDTMYENMMRAINDHSADCVMCGYKEYRSDGKAFCLPVNYPNTLISSKKEIIEQVIKPTLGFSNNPAISGCALVWNKFFSKKIIEDNKIKFNETRSLGEDWQFCLEYLSCANSIYFLGQEPYHYIHRGGGCH